MSEIAIRPAQTMSLPEKIRYAQALADSNLLPPQYRKQPANLLFALEYADALGVSPINAITSIHVIEGKPSASADLIGSLVRRAGHRLRISGDDTFALAQIIRADDPDFTFEARWDMAKARAAGLANKAVWRNYPAAMLRSRAITEVARAGAPDALFGVVYTPEELGVDVDQEGNVLATSDRVERSEPRSGADRLRDALPPTPPAGAPVPDADVVDGEVVDDPPPPITRAQLTALNAGLTALGYKGRPAIYVVLSEQLGRPIASSSDLTKDEASRLIDRIQAGQVPSPPPLASEEQVATIRGLLSDVGFESEEQQLAELVERTGRPLATPGDLTKAEADDIAAALEASAPPAAAAQ